MRIKEHYNNKIAKIVLKLANRFGSNYEKWGITIFNHIFYSHEIISKEHRSHERVHIAQIFNRHKFGWITYYPTWILNLIKNKLNGMSLIESYMAIPFEIEARNLQTDSRYSPIIFDKYFPSKSKRFYVELAIILLAILILIVLLVII